MKIKRLRIKEKISSPVFMVTTFLIVTFLCGHMAALLVNNFYKPSQEPRSIYKRIEYEVKKIISEDTRTFESMVYIGTKENKLWVGVTTSEETFNVRLFIFEFDSNYEEDEIFTHIKERGLNEAKFTQKPKEAVTLYTSNLTPLELKEVPHICKKQTFYLENNSNVIRFECGTTGEGVYSFVFDETNEETLNYNAYIGEKANVISPIWAN